MFDADAVNQPEADSAHEEQWTREQAEQHMRELLASLPPPISIEELARAQGVRIPQRWEDLIPDWHEGEWDDEEDCDVIRERWRAEEIEALRQKLAEPPSAGMKPDDFEAYERELWAAQVAAWDREHGEAPDEDVEA